MPTWIVSRLLAITGQTDSHLLHKESHQNLNVVKMFEPITKWSWSIRNARNIPEIVRRAFKIALTEKAPVLLISKLPQDVAKARFRYSTHSITGDFIVQKQMQDR